MLAGKTFARTGAYAPAVTVTDAAGHTATTSFSLTVKVHAGQLFTWGWGFSGELGDGQLDVDPVTSPLVRSAPTNVLQALQADISGYALRADGTVYSWGDNAHGQLGDGSTTGTTSPNKVPGLADIVALAGSGPTAYALQADGTVLAWGANNDGQLGDGDQVERHSPVVVAGLSHVVQLAAGVNTAYALTSDGHVWAGRQCLR